MAIIDNIISDQNFEIIAVRIGAILKDELSNQFLLGNSEDPVLDAEVFLERFVPLGDEEKFIVNVMFASSDYQGEDVTKSDGINQYFIDVETVGKWDDVDRGDKVAMANLKRLLGKIRAILRNTKYYRLLFNDPLIVQRTRVKSINISEPRDNQDSSFKMQGRMVFEVNAIENEGFSEATELIELQTRVTIGETDVGFQYFIDQNA